VTLLVRTAVVFVSTFVLLVAGAAAGFVVVFAGSGFLADLSSSLESVKSDEDSSESELDFSVVFDLTSVLAG